MTFLPQVKAWFYIEEFPLDAPKLMPKCSSSTSKAAVVVLVWALAISALDRALECCLSMLLKVVSGVKHIKPLGP